MHDREKSDNNATLTKRITLPRLDAKLATLALALAAVRSSPKSTVCNAMRNVPVPGPKKPS